MDPTTPPPGGISPSRWTAWTRSCKRWARTPKSPWARWISTPLSLAGGPSDRTPLHPLLAAYRLPGGQRGREVARDGPGRQNHPGPVGFRRLYPWLADRLGRRSGGEHRRDQPGICGSGEPARSAGLIGRRNFRAFEALCEGVMLWLLGKPPAKRERSKA